MMNVFTYRTQKALVERLTQEAIAAYSDRNFIQFDLLRDQISIEKKKLAEIENRRI